MKLQFCMECKTTLTKHNDTDYSCNNGHYFWNNPKAAVAVAFVRNDKLLYSKRGIEPNKGMYDLPGGFVNFNESAYDAAVREIQEELGVLLKREQLQLIEVYKNLYNETVSSIDLVFLVTEWEGEPQLVSETQELWWGPLEFVRDPQFCETDYTTLDERIREATSSSSPSTVQ